MSRTLLAAVLAATLLPDATSAAVFSRDWKTPGDGLLTYDDVNKREWLDLTASRLNLFAGTNFEQRYATAIQHTEPGGLLAGFRAAKANDLGGLAWSAGMATDTYDFPTNQGPTAALIQLVGPSLFPAVGGAVAFGLLHDVGSVPSGTSMRLTGELFVNPDSGPNGVAGILIAPGAGDTLSTTANTGIWLYRSVPEPSGTVSALLASILGIWRQRRAG